MSPLPGARGTGTPVASAAATWRFVDDGASDGATNMARDVALLDHARRTGESTLRVYAWAVPTLSFGRHERTRGRFDPASLGAAGVAAVRRPTGGRALLHHREVTYSVTAPVHGLSLAESYRSINALLVDALGRLGVEVHAAARQPDARPLRPGSAACFAEPNEGELTFGGRKLAGSAQWREEGALLQHGSILLADDQARIASLSAPADRAPHAAALPVATLSGALEREVTYAEVSAALRRALAERCQTAGVTSPAILPSHSGTSDTDAMLRHRDRFRDPAWTWCR